MKSIVDAMNDITRISEDPEIYAQNFMEGSSYYGNLYSFMNRLKLAVPLDEVKFLPSFKGKYVVEKLGIGSVDKENEMKVFRVQSSLFLEDTTVLSIKKELSDLCEQIEKERDIIIFYLP